MGKKKAKTWRESLYIPPQLRGRRNLILSRAFAIQHKLITLKRAVGLDDGIFLLKQYSREYKIARIYRRRVGEANQKMLEAIEKSAADRKVAEELTRENEVLRGYLPDTFEILGGGQ